MKQPKIHIKDTHGTDFGIREVFTLYWDAKGKVIKLNTRLTGILQMTHVVNTENEFINANGNLIGTIIYETENL